MSVGNAVGRFPALRSGMLSGVLPVPFGSVVVSAEDATGITSVELSFHLSDEPSERGAPLIREALKGLRAYFEGSLDSASLIPVRCRGSRFQHRVWEALTLIPAGTTVTYGKLASMLGSSPRAVAGSFQMCGK